ncbi:toll-like receptor 3 [Strongylocentrotus purpuratus]|uniref:TIR domain-containing protein n=1 Tax=Strongylocentrotus purpuratus TaxID=7668 RepID=A0A7M7N8M2_STRPU|nr:toll-like receptor 3 [Strongylocentrotus purpuratus]
MRMSDLYSTLFVIITLTSIHRRETIEAASCLQDLSLKAAYCSHKGFRSVPTDLLPDLRRLQLDYNLLTTLTNETFERYPSLRELDLGDNNISRIDEGAFNPLKNLFSGELHTIQNGFFAPLKGKNLDKVDIGWNSIVMIEDNGFDGLAGVSELQLGRNNLEEIEPSVFNGMMALRTLSLDADRIITLNRNELTYLDSNLFKYLSGLVHLDASRNRISGLNRSTFEPLARLTTLDLSLNPLVCNCDLKWLPGWLKGTVELIESTDTTCIDNAVTLEPFRGKQLITFDPRDECGPNIILYSCLAMLGMVLIFALGLIYYQRWWIRYRLFLLKLCFIGYEEKYDEVDRGEFQYDIAIMLDEADDMWVNQHLRPALMERVPAFNRIVCGDEELMLGMYYLDAVHYATEKSFKTIIVISHAALQDQWFMMKFRTVLDHVNDIGTEKMILVFVEDVVDDELPFLIRLFLSDHRPYLVWPDDERGRDYFWEELIRDLKINLRCNHLIPPN